MQIESVLRRLNALKFFTIVGLMGILAMSARGQEGLCTQETVRLVGHLNHLSNPMGNPTDLAEFVTQYRAYLVSDGTAIKCAKRLGKRLVGQSLSAFSQADYDAAYGGVLAMGGDMDMAHDVAASIRSGALELYVLGKELLWLANVIPSAASGDWGLYNNTGTETRNAIRQVMPIYQQLINMDPAMAQSINNLLTQFGPLAAYQVSMLAQMMGEI